MLCWHEVSQQSMVQKAVARHIADSAQVKLIMVRQTGTFGDEVLSSLDSFHGMPKLERICRIGPKQGQPARRFTTQAQNAAIGTETIYSQLAQLQLDHV